MPPERTGKAMLTMGDELSRAERGRSRVLYVDTAPTAGGSVVSLFELLKGLDRSLYEPVVLAYTPHPYVERFRSLGVDVIVWNAYGAEDHRPGWIREARASALAQGLKTHSWGSSIYHGLGFALLLLRRMWPRARALKQIIRQKGIDLVHTNIRVGHDREGIIAARMAGIPCVCHIRDFEQLNWFDRKLAGSVAAFIYISRAVQRLHLEAGVPCERGYIVYNAVDTAAFAQIGDARRVRLGFGLAEGELAVGLVGRLERWKGQDVFLQAMALVKDSLPNVKAIIIGDPLPYDPHYGEELVALRDKLGLTQKVVFSGFRQDVRDVMSALDLVVLASTSPEPFGRVLIEAMAAGKPVVATDSGAACEIIDGGVQGLLVPPGDARALAEAIVHVLSHSEVAEHMGRCGQTRARERFNLEQYVDGVQTVYRQVLRRHRLQPSDG